MSDKQFAHFIIGLFIFSLVFAAIAFCLNKIILG